MPDSITYESVATATPKKRTVRRIHMDVTDPVAAGLISAEELAAVRRHHRAIEREDAHGLADPRALRGIAALNGWPMNPPIRRGSIRYWALIAFYEEEWVRARNGFWTGAPVSESKLLPREQLGQVVLEAYRQLFCHEYHPYSRFSLTLAEQTGDEAGAEKNRSFDRQERRRLLLRWKAKHQTAMKASLAAIAKYRAALTATCAF